MTTYNRNQNILICSYHQTINIFLYKKIQEKEEFTNMGAKSNYLPNQTIPPQNYPIVNVKELTDTVHAYPNPNTATDKYFDQTLYEKRVENGEKVNNKYRTR